MEAERREDLIALIQSVRDGEPLQVDASVALRMIAVRLEEGLSDILEPDASVLLRLIAAKVSEGLDSIPETEDTEQIRAVFYDMLDIIDRAK